MIYGPYRARCVEIHDGDTIYFDLDLGFGFQLASHNIDGRLMIACRVWGINAPELSTQPGKDALAYAQ